VREVKVPSEPEALLAVLKNPAYHFEQIGLEAGPLSQWLYSALAEAELPVICVETRHMRAVLKAQINKTDRNAFRSRRRASASWTTQAGSHEYLGLSRWRRLCYRVYRHPIIMFGLGPAFLFIVQHRLPFGLMRAGWQPWLSTMATNVAIAAFGATMIWLVGVVPFLLVHLPIVLLAASVGVWLFYVQHQFEDTEWARDGVWNLHEVALHGGSYYDLPSVMRWFTANIGVHHIHHLCSRIPYYRLPLVLRDYPDVSVIGRLTLVESFRCARLVLWDEGQQRLVSFHAVRQRCALV
jgi:fatty acid desaturase